MPSVTKSLRQYLQGSIVDFSERSEMLPLATATNLTALIVNLASLQEEGFTLAPEVFLCEQIKEVLKLLPGHERINIGITSDATEALAQALKKCAPLAIRGWCIFISKDENNYQYGLFRGSLNPLTVSIHQTLFSEPLESIKLIRLFRTATGCVELCNHVGDTHSILLNDKPESAPLPNAYKAELISAICEHVSEQQREPTRTYLDKTLHAALAACHGTLIAVTSKNSVPSFLKDGVILSEPIDLAAAIRLMQENPIESNAEHLLSADAALIQGMISCDGITVFNTSGKLLAYNCFVSSPNKVGGKTMIGGARTRAYLFLCQKVGHGLMAAFIQSQDGWTKFKKA